ncbi:MAG TPA: TonB family protein, partial [Myxococcales bacterium]|nr:TonB family protein [Myxococcales bacterium]
MRTPTLRAAALFALAIAVPALPQEAYEGAVRRGEKPPPPPPQLTKPPQLLRSVEPAFPPEAAEAKLSGDVTMEIEIAPDGTVSGARVVQGAGHGFDEAAVAAVRQFAFSPAEIDGKPAPVRIQYTQHFVFQEPARPAEPPPKPITFKGRILERGTRKPLPGAAVKVTGTALVAVADEEGRFQLALDPGAVAVEVVEPAHLPSKGW